MVLQVVERQRCGVVFMPGSRMAGVVIVYERDYLFIVCRSLPCSAPSFYRPVTTAHLFCAGHGIMSFICFLGFVFVVLC